MLKDVAQPEAECLLGNAHLLSVGSNKGEK